MSAGLTNSLHLSIYEMIEVILSMNIYVSRRTDELIPLPNVNMVEPSIHSLVYKGILASWNFIIMCYWFFFVIWTFGILL